MGRRRERTGASRSGAYRIAYRILPDSIRQNPYQDHPTGILGNCRACGRQCPQETASMRSRAMRAGAASCRGTLIWLTTLPATRFSSAQAKCWGSMRAMGEHMHTVVDMNCTSLPVDLYWSAMRLTRFNSVLTG